MMALPVSSPGNSPPPRFPPEMCVLIGKPNRRERPGVRQGTQLLAELVTTWKFIQRSERPRSQVRDLEVDGSAHHPPLNTEPDSKESRGSRREQALGSAARRARARAGGTQPAALCPCPGAKATPRTGEAKGDERRGKGWEPRTAAHFLSSFLTF